MRNSAGVAATVTPVTTFRREASQNSSCPGRSAKRVFALEVPGIHGLNESCRKKDVDGRDKPGHDEERIIFKLLKT